MTLIYIQRDRYYEGMSFVGNDQMTRIIGLNLDKCIEILLKSWYQLNFKFPYIKNNVFKYSSSQQLEYDFKEKHNAIKFVDPQ